MVIRVKARKCEHYKLKYCLTSSLGILSYAEGSKTTDCQDTVLILGKRMRDSLDMGKHHVKNWPPHPKIDPLIPSGQTPKMISTYQYRRKSLWIHWSSSHPLELKSRPPWQILTFGGLRKKEERKERKKERKERKKKVFPLRVGFRNYILFGCFLGITVAIS